MTAEMQRILWNTARDLQSTVKQASKIEDLRKRILEIAAALQEQVVAGRQGKVEP
jgi:hypothetical protein